MTKRHKVFVSYHHDNDQQYKDQFQRLFTEVFDIMISRAVDDGDIDPNNDTETIKRLIREKHLSDSTVTIVLIGKDTWKRKHVDWEIAGTLRHTMANPRGGLLGILLPSYQPDYFRTRLVNGSSITPNTIPPRLWDNISNGYAKLYPWGTNPFMVQEWIHQAFQRKENIIPDNSIPHFKNNRSGDGWQ